MAKGGHSHRSTLRNEHKAFKSKHASKGQLKKQYKGKVEKSSAGTNKAIKVISKLERKNLSKQKKETKIIETKLTRKIFEGSNGAEKIVTIITLTNDISSQDIAQRLLNSVKNEEDDEIIFDYPSVNSIKVGRFKSNLKIVLPDQSNLLSILDAAKVSDFVVFGISATEEVEKDYGEQILRAIIAQGVASVIGVLPNIATAYPKRNLQLDIKQSLFSFFTHFFPSEEKLFTLENESECSNCVRFLCQKFPKSITWRDSRGYVLADNVFWSGSDSSDGYLVVEGTTRGAGFNSNRLVHIPGYGDYQIEKIEKISKGYRDINGESIFLPNENQEGLEFLNPEEIEMDSNDLEGDNDDLGVRMDGKTYFNDSESRKAVKVPKGTSEYQSRWFLEDDPDSESENEEEPEDTNAMVDDLQMDGEMEMDDDNDVDAQSELFVELSAEEEERQLQEFRSLEKDDLDFPDEIELQPNQSAKEVLANYRGIKSLANCDWRYDEEDIHTPDSWKRLLRVSNYRATRNKVCKDAIKEAQVNLGDKIRVYLRVSPEILQKVNPQVSPFVIYELLHHEHKLGVVNMSFETWEDYEKPIQSKDMMIAQYGPRRQVIRPVFNQASNNANNVHKAERFVHKGNLSIATCIAPVLFNNAPIIYFKPSAEGSVELVGQGTFLNCDHTRIISERAVITGEPVKIHKRLVTIRYMFFSPEDIKYFKAIPLFTKSGRTGFIKESLGTHGYFKATFDGKLTSQDIVAMSLYKRVWPEVSTAWNE